jgi:prepilin-type N-terminal cleavage/methylation domain-containing protein
MRNTKRNERGFSLLEAVVVIGIMAVLSGMAIYQSFGSIETYEANSAMDIVSGQLRVARQLAISQRRPVAVTFLPSSTDHNLPAITYQLQDTVSGDLALENAGAPALPMTMVLPRQTQYLLEAGVPDTPMAFGMCGPVCIGGTNGGPPTMYFAPTGQFSSDEAGMFPLNGTIFLGLPSQPGTARAVTIMGSTGRVRFYTYIVASPGYWTE